MSRTEEVRERKNLPDSNAAVQAKTIVAPPQESNSFIVPPNGFVAIQRNAILQCEENYVLLHSLLFGPFHHLFSQVLPVFPTELRQTRLHWVVIDPEIVVDEVVT